jgi:hypothetical protein
VRLLFGSEIMIRDAAADQRRALRPTSPLRPALLHLNNPLVTAAPRAAACPPHTRQDAKRRAWAQPVQARLR